MRCIVVTLLLISSLEATTFEAVSTAELAHRADRVVTARCVRCRVVKDPKSGLVFTETELQLLEDLKGPTRTSRIVLRLPGGELDGVKTIVAGMPQFESDREYVVMLGKKNRAGFETVVAAQRGVMKVVRTKSGKRRLRGPMTGFAELKNERVVSLSSFRQALRKDAERRAAKERKKPVR